MDVNGFFAKKKSTFESNVKFSCLSKIINALFLLIYLIIKQR